MQDYPVRLLEKMLKTYSPSGEEKEIADFLSQEMEKAGFKISKDEVGNVIGEIGQGSPSILLCGHMDTVPGFIPVRFEGDVIYGRGAVDAKASLAAMLIASAEVIKRQNHGRLLLAAVVDEEGTGKGIRNIIKKGISADYAIFGEPSGVANITIGYKGSLRLRIGCVTEAGHVAAPWLFDNAIEKAFEIWKAIANIHFAEEDLKSRFYSTTCCLTKIEGGNDSGRVPSRCTFQVDIRTPPQVTAERFLAKARDCADHFLKQNQKMNISIEVEDTEEPFETDKSSPLVRSFSYAIRRVTSKSATLLRKTGTGDVNTYALAIARPMIAYGPGDSHLDHTLNEHISVSEYLRATQVYQEALNKLLVIHQAVQNHITQPEKS